MAQAPKKAYEQNPAQVVQTSRKLWSEIVESVDPLASNHADNPAEYVFSNGRTFTERKK